MTGMSSMTRIKYLAAIVGLALTAGCKSTAPPPPRVPPPAPVARTVPLDRQLISAAQLELNVQLQSTDPIARAHVLEAFEETNSTERRTDVINALGDTQSIVRFAAAMAAGALRIHDAHDPLTQMLDDSSENVRVAVRYALHRLNDKHASHDLEKMANDADPRVRANVAMVLGLLGEPSATGLLQVLRSDSAIQVRLQASEALWRLGNEDGLKDLVGLTVSRYPDDQMFGYIALALPKNTSVRQHVRGGLIPQEGADKDPGQEKWLAIPLVAARAMGMLASDEGYGLALKGAASRDSQLRMLAALAFGTIGRTDAQDQLRKLLNDGDATVRLAAATAILQLKGS